MRSLSLVSFLLVACGQPGDYASAADLADVNGRIDDNEGVDAGVEGRLSALEAKVEEQAGTIAEIQGAGYVTGADLAALGYATSTDVDAAVATCEAYADDVGSSARAYADAGDAGGMTNIAYDLVDASDDQVIANTSTSTILTVPRVDYVKKSATSVLSVTWTSILGVNGGGSCYYAVVVDGERCDPGTQFSDRHDTSTGYMTQSASWICEATDAGAIPTGSAVEVAIEVDASDASISCQAFGPGMLLVAEVEP